ncbi:GntR family transcriptional regulator [Streptomyces vinaceus]|uniref:GntR family transcriptional regulator n=1 Tax=Streptomyces vinaceus TaxID=1960 RepID=UPI0035E31764
MLHARPCGGRCGPSKRRGRQGRGRRRACGDRRRRAPPYERIMNDLLGQIRSGELPAGARLPSEAALAETYSVARGTVRRAVRELETAGHVEARHGVGRFVRFSS